MPRNTMFATPPETCTHPHRLIVGIVTGWPTYWSENDDATSIHLTSHEPTIVLLSSTMNAANLAGIKGHRELGTIGFIEDAGDDVRDEEATHDLTLTRACELFQDVSMAALHAVPTTDLFQHILLNFPVVDKSRPLVVQEVQQDPGGLALSAITVYTEHADPTQPYGVHPTDEDGNEVDSHIVWKWAKSDSYYGKLTGPWKRHLPEVLANGAWHGGRDLHLMARRVTDEEERLLPSTSFRYPRVDDR